MDTDEIAQKFKKEVNEQVRAFLYPDVSAEEDAGTVTDIEPYSWGFLYLWEGAVSCAVVVRPDGQLEDHADVGFDEDTRTLIPVHGFVIHPSIESLIAAMVANEADSIDDYDITVEQRVERDRLHDLDAGVFTEG